VAVDHEGNDRCKPADSVGKVDILLRHRTHKDGWEGKSAGKVVEVDKVGIAYDLHKDSAQYLCLDHVDTGVFVIESGNAVAAVVDVDAKRHLRSVEGAAEKDVKRQDHPDPSIEMLGEAVVVGPRKEIEPEVGLGLGLGLDSDAVDVGRLLRPVDKGIHSASLLDLDLPSAGKDQDCNMEYDDTVVVRNEVDNDRS
jgi:hypothetical protein